jgi:cytochrome c oxidase assembly factor CtaG
MSTERLVLEVTYWAPLIALFVVSLGLVALKRIMERPPWTERLVAPPFYLVSLPIATLLVGTELLAWVVLIVHLKKFMLFSDTLPGTLFVVLFGFFFAFLNDPVGLFVPATVVFVLFCATFFISGYLLWWTLRYQDQPQDSSYRAKQRRWTLLLLLAFVYAFVALRSFLLFIAGGTQQLRVF